MNGRAISNPHVLVHYCGIPWDEFLGSRSKEEHQATERRGRRIKPTTQAERDACLSCNQTTCTRGWCKKVGRP